MKSHDIRLEKLIRICEVLEIHPVSLLEKSMTENGQGREYTAEQERHFSEVPVNFLIFIKALYGFPYEIILKVSKLKEHQFIKSLRAMEKVGLLQLQSKNRIHVLLKGPFRMRSGGLLESKLAPLFRNVLFSHFSKFPGSTDTPVSQNISLFRPFQMHLEKETALEFGVELAQLLRKYRSLSHSNYQNSSTINAVSGIIALDIFDAWERSCLGDRIA